MKKLTIILFLFSVLSLMSSPVSMESAAKAAENLCYERNGVLENYKSIEELKEDGQTVMYAVHFEGGFVLVSADDAAYPIFGYSFENELDLENIPPQMEFFLEWQKEEILFSILSGESATPEIRTEWARLSSDNFTPFRNLRNVSPLLETNWDQGQYYNALCPADPDGPGGHVWAGCVATAMAQVMKYWEFPETGNGSHTYYHWNYGTQTANFGATTYNWNSMPNNVYNSNTAVATLLYHLGVSVDMDYGVNGSGAYGSDARDALVDYFLYEDTASLLYRNSYTSTAWATMLRNELDAGRPLYYRGQNSSGGHAFNLDGYQGTDYFHFNWGWSGYNNGYFYLDDLTPGSHNYNLQQAAIFYLEPSLQPEITVTSPNGGESYALEDQIEITWESEDAGSNVSIMLYEGTSLDHVISSQTVNDGSFLWTIPANQACDEDFKIKISDHDDSAVFDYSDQPFTIYDPVINELENVVITIGSDNVNQGDSFSIPIDTNNLDIDWNIISYQFTLLYDTSILDYTGYSTGDFAGNLLAYEGTPGEVVIAYATSMPISGAGILSYIDFTAIEEGTAVLDIEDFRYNTYDITNVILGEVIVNAYNPYEEVAITVGSGSAYIGESVEIPVTTTMLTEEMGAISFQFDIDFDPDILSFEECILGEVPNASLIISNEITPGHLRVAYANTLPVSGEGSLCIITFSGLAEGSSVLDLYDFKYDQNYLSNLVDGSVNVMEHNPFEEVIITAGNGVASVGESVEIPVSTSLLLEEMGVISYQFDVIFDPAIVEYQSCSLGELPNASLIMANEYEPGHLRVAYANAITFYGEGNLCYLTFAGLTEGISVLEISEFKYNQNYLSNLVDGSIEVSNIQYPNWSVNPNAFEYTGNIWGIVFLNDIQIDVTSGMLGCFVGDECRGIAQESDGSIIDYTAMAFGHVAFMPTVYSDATSGEIIEFLYFDPVSGEIYQVAETIEFVSDMTIGNGFAPFEFHASTVTTVDIAKDVVSGWNWFSLNVIGEDMDINAVLASLGENGNFIKSQTQSAYYYGSTIGWEGNLSTINTTSAYKLEMINDSSIEFTGVPVNLQDQTYNLSGGWNWISYAPQIAEDINYALGSMENGATIKNQNQYAYYYGEDIGWAGSMEELYPLDGYKLQMNDSEAFNYPEPEYLRAQISNIEPDHLSMRDPEWFLNPPDYEYNGSIWGSVMIDGNPTDDISDMLGVFVGDECRGIATSDNSSVQDFTEPFGYIAFMPMVFSNETFGETLNFRFYDASEDITYQLEQTMDWEADMMVGNGFEPYVFYVDTNAEEEDQISDFLNVNCYPNPFNPEISISFTLSKTQSARLSIYNAKGQRINTLHNDILTEGNHIFQWDGKDFNGLTQANGVYFYKLNIEGKLLSGKMLMMK